MRAALLILLLTLSPLLIQAQSWLDSAITLIKKNDVRLAQEVLNKITDDKFLKQIEPNSQKHDSLCLLITEQITKGITGASPLIRTVAHSHFGAQLVFRKKMKEGQLQLQQARKLAMSIKGIAPFILYEKYVNVFWNISRLDSAVFYAKKMLEYAGEIKNDSLESVALGRVGGLSYGIQQYQQASRYIKILNERTHDERERRGNYNTIGLCFRNQRMFDSARFYFDKGLTLAYKFDTLYIGLISGNIGDTYFMEGRYKEAIPYLETELAYSTKKQMNKIAIDCMNTLTMLYLNLNDLKMADFYYERLTQHAPEWDDITVKLNYYKLSSVYFQKKNNYEKSMQYFSRYQTVYDSLESVKNIQRASEVSAQYDFDQQRREIDLLQQQNLLQLNENRQKNYLLYGSLFTIMLVAALSVTLFINYHQKRKSLALIREKNDTLEKVNEELVTSMERIEEQNQRITELADHLSKINASKDKLFSIIGHDLRNPMYSLKGLLKLALAGNITADEFTIFSTKLNESVDHIDFTLNNLLQWARTQMQGMTVNMQEVDLLQLTKENINFLSDVARHKNISLINEISDVKPVHADVNQVNLVIRNLISNAIKFTPENGRVIMSITMNEKAVEMRVMDSGTGMTEETVRNLFKIGTHITTPGTQGEKGSGLGLLLCYEMIDKNEGKIGVESKLGEGSTFWFTLPLAY